MSLRHLKFSKFKIELIYSFGNLPPVFSLKDGGGFHQVMKSKTLESSLNFHYIHTHVQTVTKSGWNHLLNPSPINTLQFSLVTVLVHIFMISAIVGMISLLLDFHHMLAKCFVFVICGRGCCFVLISLLLNHPRTLKCNTELIFKRCNWPKTCISLPFCDSTKVIIKY